jgi:hypothetical protein
MKVVQCLLSHGADPNIKDADGRSTLYILALENRLAMAEYFIDPGEVDVECTDFEVITNEKFINHKIKSKRRKNEELGNFSLSSATSRSGFFALVASSFFFTLYIL